MKRVDDKTATRNGAEAAAEGTRAGALNISRSPAGFVTGTTLGTTSDSYTLNNFGEPLRYTAKVGEAAVYDVTYTRDGAGRITGKTETIANPIRGGADGCSAAYTYDAANRLNEVQHNGVVTAQHQYDDNGNRQNEATAFCVVSAPGKSPTPASSPTATNTSGSPTPTATQTPTPTPTIAGVVIIFNGSTVLLSTTVDDQDRLTDVSLLDPFCTLHQYHYTYAPCGELQTKTEEFPDNPQLNKVTSYSYDAFGNLRTADLPDGTHIEYLIDAANRRVGKKINGTRVQGLLYQDSLRPVAELDTNNNVTRVFVYGSKGNVPDYIENADGTRYRIISDQVGSVRLVLDATTGAILQRLDYDEYGAVILDTNPGFQPFGFAGGLYDPDTRIVRFGARDYDPETGRWAARDPIGFGGNLGNLYGYVLGDPINSSDPQGTIGAETIIITGIIVTAGVAGAYGLYNYFFNTLPESIRSSEAYGKNEERISDLEDQLLAHKLSPSGEKELQDRITNRQNLYRQLQSEAAKVAEDAPDALHNGPMGNPFSKEGAVSTLLEVPVDVMKAVDDRRRVTKP